MFRPAEAVGTASFGGSAEDVKVSSSSLLYERNISSASCSSNTASNQNMFIILSSVSVFGQNDVLTGEAYAIPCVKNHIHVRKLLASYEPCSERVTTSDDISCVHQSFKALFIHRMKEDVRKLSFMQLFQTRGVFTVTDLLEHYHSVRFY